jgi:signal transduction histidine kinase/HAMP domain-containing protein
LDFARTAVSGTHLAKGDSMLSLKSKLYLGVAGLAGIAIAVSLIGLNVIGSYGSALKRILRENYRSIEYCQLMSESLRQTEAQIVIAILDSAHVSHSRMDSAFIAFEDNLRQELSNLTVPGERQAADSVAELWHAYKYQVRFLIDSAQYVPARHTYYAQHIAPIANKTRNLVKRISDMNLRNMSTVDGQAQAKAQNAEFITWLLVISGTLLAFGLVIITGRAVLKPIDDLTDAIREVQRGNLNLALKRHSNDEVGQLTDAFNDMAAQLREFRRLEQAQLIRTEHATQAVLDSLPDAAAIVNEHGMVELSNIRAQELFGLEPNVNLTERQDDILREVFFSALLLERSTESIGISGAVQVFHGGEEKFYLPHAIPILGDQRNVIGVTLIMADVTRLRRITELEMEPISVVSHELKTPLTSMRMAIHMLLDERIGSLNTKQAELLNAARDDSNRLDRIVDNLLDIGRIEAGQGQMELKPLSPDKLVRDAANEFQVAYRSAGVEMSLDLPADLPDVLADPTRIPHVFSNLLSNALKYSPAGSIVKLRAEANESSVVFSVQDRGPGIDDHDLSRVFQRFYRVSNQKAKGAGLGLAIAKEIVDAHGGAIGVKSHPGEGSLFEFTLKRADVKEAQNTTIT